MKVVFSSSF